MYALVLTKTDPTAKVMTDVMQLCFVLTLIKKPLNLREPNWACSKLTHKVF